MLRVTQRRKESRPCDLAAWPPTRPLISNQTTGAKLLHRLSDRWTKRYLKMTTDESNKNRKQTTRSIIKAVKNIAEYFGPCFSHRLPGTVKNSHNTSLWNIPSRKKTIRIEKKAIKKATTYIKRKRSSLESVFIWFGSALKGLVNISVLKINYRLKPKKIKKRTPTTMDTFSVYVLFQACSRKT